MIAIAGDHSSIEMKRDIIAFLEQQGYACKDLGTHTSDSTDYPVYGLKAARAVAGGEFEKGIVICGTGIGISISCNKIKGIRCALCTEPLSAALSRQHNNANMLALGARILGPELARAIVKAFLESDFEGDINPRHARRVAQIAELDDTGTIA